MLGFIAVSNLLVLFIAFRSILIPLKAFVMNMLSIAASFGVLVVVFQTGIIGEDPEKSPSWYLCLYLDLFLV
jgi:RND superfamily putative drug exporter